MAVLSAPQIRALFAQEAEIRLAQLGQHLLALESNGADMELIGSIFRELHTLKGSSAVAGLPTVSDCAHELEGLVEDLRSGRTSTTPTLIDTLLAGVDTLAEVIQTAVAAGDAAAPGPAPIEPAPARSTGDTEPAPAPLTPPAMPADVTAPADVIAPFDVVAPSAVISRAPDMAPANVEAPPAMAVPAWTTPADAGGVVMVPLERLDELTRLISESASAHLRVGRMLSDKLKLDPASITEFNELSRALNDLQDRAMRTQMVAVSTVTDALHRTVRDLARAQGKDIRWDARGTDTELDRGVLRRLSDSLIHLVRNAVDHGIETPAERIAAGKPPIATVRIHAMQLGSEVIIAITDDGRGIDLERVKEEANRHGVSTDALSDEDVAALTLRSGLSTKTFVTDVSGRGVGLDVVRTNVEAARGRIEVRSQPGQGAEFRVIVPITLAVLRCLLVEAGGARYALPFHRVVRSESGQGTTRAHAEGNDMVWVDDGQAVPLSVLTETLGMPADSESVDGPIVFLADSARRHAFRIDRLIGQRDVVLKGLSAVLPNVPAVAGASVEPDGSILLVLDPPGLIQRARQSRPVRSVRPAPPGAGDETERPGILVVDDALTVRELQRSILERANFSVRVAADGVQALAMLNELPSDLVLTDVEMPLMDGFALTEAIRATESLSNIPVLILSSRSSDADRQRGLDVGADGYIVKSGFDETALLTAVGRLLGSRL